MTGRLVAVVGPSGVGKDSVMEGIAAAKQQIRLVKRVITRPTELGGEDYTGVTPDGFAALVAEGAFCLHWQAHGLSYGIPSDVLTDAKAGRTCLANLSRSALQMAASVFPDVLVLNITASDHVLAQRLRARGRETARQIADRLAQAQKPLPAGLQVVSVSNDGPLSETVAAACAALQPVRA